MTRAETLSAALAAITDASRVVREHQALLEAPESIAPLLVELVEADRAYSDHYAAWRHEYTAIGSERSPECREAWDRCYLRREKASAAILRFARAYVERGEDVLRQRDHALEPGRNDPAGKAA